MIRKMDALKGRINGQLLKADAAPKSALLAMVDSRNLTIEMYGEIGASLWGDGITAAQVADALKSDFDTVTVRINSPGGDCFEGVAIYNLLKGAGRPVAVIVDGLAASAASIVAMAGDTVSMSTGTMMMIHPAFMLYYGNSVDFHEAAAILEKATGNMADIYAARTGRDRAAILQMMYDETWMIPTEAVELGFATEAVTTPGHAGEIAAAYNLTVFEKVPESLKTFLAATTPDEPVTHMANLATRELQLYGEK